MGWKSYVNAKEDIRALLHPAKNDNLVIDGLRGLSITMIILFHCFYGAFFLLRDPDKITQFIDSIPQWMGFVFTAEKAVDIFFMISAYLLGFSLLHEFKNHQKIDKKKFYLKRFFRIYPLFFVAFVLNIPASGVKSLADIFYNLIFINNLIPYVKHIIPVGWSLCVEMQFYLILPYVIVFLSKVKRPLSWLLGFCLLSIGVLLVLCLLQPIIYETPFYKFGPKGVDPEPMLHTVYYPTYGRFGPLIVGLLWASIKFFQADTQFFEKIKTSHKDFILNILWVLSAVIAIGMMYYPSYHDKSCFNQDFHTFLNLGLLASHRVLFCLGLMGLLLLSNKIKWRIGPWFLKILSFRFWRPLSQLVFPMYLFHFLLIIISAVLVFRTIDVSKLGMISFWQIFGVFLFSVPLTMLFSLAFHIYIEKPGIRFGYRLTSKKNKT